VKRSMWVCATLAALTLALAACGGDDESTDTTAEGGTDPTTTQAPTTAAPEPEATTTTAPEGMGEPITACQVTDTGGIDDKSFNQTAWKGVTDAQAAGYASDDSDYVESQTATDYQPNIQAFLDKGCDLIVTVGFLLGGDTQAMAEANPDRNFQIIDFAYEEGLVPNVQGAIFGTTDAAFLAGYLAAGMTQTGTIATYGGIQVGCPVTCFMDGFVYGARYYNEVKGADVKVLGWNPEEETGVFTGDFEDELKGRNVTQSFVDEGADVVLPVAGPVGKGSAALALEQGDLWVIGVDADWFDTLPEYEDVILTSVLKGLDVAVFTAIKEVSEGMFQGGTRLYTIAEDGVGVGALAADVPADLAAEVEEIRAQLKDGSLVATEFKQS